VFALVGRSDEKADDDAGERSDGENDGLHGGLLYTPIRPGGPAGESHPAAPTETVFVGDGSSAERRPALQRPCDYGPKVGSDGTFGWGRRDAALLPKQKGPVNSRCTKVT
jgi:hypothetical protein